jgi:hypothetical protein
MEFIIINDYFNYLKHLVFVDIHEEFLLFIPQYPHIPYQSQIYNVQKLSLISCIKLYSASL